MPSPRTQSTLLLTLLTLAALAIHGYHPYAEDGGLYLAGIEHRLDPTLFPHSAAFVQGHPRLSAFTAAAAALVRVSHADLETALFFLYLGSLALTLYAAWQLAARIHSSPHARLGAVSLLTAWLTLPLAGTSLLLVDPYLTARSLSTPFSLLALTAALDLFCLTPDSPRRPLPRLILWVSLAALMHPLMAVYAIGAILALAFASLPAPRHRLGALAALCTVALAVAASVQALAPPEVPAATAAALTRSYWFLGQWQWFELLGLAAPLILLPLLARRTVPGSPLRPLSDSSVALGITAILVLLLFGHPGFATHFVARLQPLRVFALIYFILILTLGALLGKKLLKSRPVLTAATLAALAAVMLFAERQSFPASDHLELPSTLLHRAPRNLWEQAFLWVRDHTPTDALFALDARYIRKDGEDAQVFRAIARRSALPDYTKDGGDAANTPALAPQWTATQTVDATLSRDPDSQRLSALLPLHVTWIVLDAAAYTTLPCPYTNPAVKVCRLTPDDTGDSPASPAHLQ